MPSPLVPGLQSIVVLLVLATALQAIALPSSTDSSYIKRMQSTLPHLHYANVPFRLPQSQLNFQQQQHHRSIESFSIERGPNGIDLQVVQEYDVNFDNADWLRIYFEPAETFLVPDSMVQIISHLDGAAQWLDAHAIQEWAHSSAYFNGNSVTVRLLQPVDSVESFSRSRIQLASVDVGSPQPAQTESLCTSEDRRQLSYFRKAGRIMPVGCTGWLIDDQKGCFLSAGHCKPSITSTRNYVIQFQVPMSHPNGTVRHPAPIDQYPIDHESIQHHQNIQPGNDWMYFGAYPNSNTRLTPRDAQKDFYVLAKNLSQAIPSSGSTLLEVIGYGTTYYPLRAKSQVQQVHQGQFLRSARNRDGIRWSLEYRVDTTGGNSGSAVTNVQTGEAIAVHAYAGCGNDDVQTGNSGTFLGQVHLQQALSSPKGICMA